MFFRHHSDKLLIPVVLGLLFVMSSYRAKYHLRADMPSGFFATKSPGSPEKKVAQAYWNAAQTEIQWKYVHGHPLPFDPPPEFQIDARIGGAAASDPAVRLLYWRRLQQAWALPETWTKDYAWDFGWVSDPIAAGGNWLKEEADRIFSTH
jgi:hypothetical protein